MSTHKFTADLPNESSDRAAINSLATYAIFALYIITALTTLHSRALANQPSTNLQDSLLKQQLIKINLEIANLNRDKNETITLTPYLPIITALVAIGGFWFTISKFLSDRKNERTLRRESQFTESLEEILSFPSQDSPSLSKVRFHISNIHALLEYLPERRADVSSMISKLIRDDCDFDLLKHIQFFTIALESWQPYAEALKSDSSEYAFINYKLFQALRHIHDEASEYVESIRYDRNGGFKVAHFTDESRFLRFEAIIRTYRYYVSLAPDSNKALDAVAHFAEATQNIKLTQDIFGLMQEA